ncbi:ATR-interacting protein isoform X5 [Mobula hypostoma]|uniref:ATR-interacting protein isoform X5 n=1 Tax=Mobula hypostoma TaxID=723540 RepID=UPI002FC2BC80
MSTNSLFINSGKKRNSSIIYSVENLPSEVPVSAFSGLSNQGKKNTNYESEGFPPNKRHKGEQAKDARASEDPFGDNDDFTADDLEELDTLASQVLIQDMKPASSAMIATATDKQSREMSVLKNDANAKVATISSRALNCGNTAKEFHENGLIQCKNANSFGFEVLQEQHSKLRKQFNETREELQIKNGEIRILRDCLRRVESELDQQKTQYLLSEKEKSVAQSQREKDLSKKVQSLQSELQFKEAEMNELRTKFRNCERTTKSPILGVAKVSPRRCSSGPSASPQTARSYFPDKKSFAAEMSPVRSICSPSAGNQLTSDKETRDLKEFHIAKKEMPKKSLSLTSILGKSSRDRHSEGSPSTHSIFAGERKQAPWSKADVEMASGKCRRQVEGAVLVTMLLSQPVGPRSLGLSHLLNCSCEAFTGLVHYHSCCSAFHHLLSSQVLLRCLSPDSSCSTVLLVVQILANLADHVELASRFCSQSGKKKAACLFLNLYTYASSRPDNSASEGLWLQLEQEIVRFITKFGLSHSGASAVLVELDCPCNTEILKTLIVMLHRQWLTIRLSTQDLPSLGNQAIVQFLREAVMLLHSLSQRDKNFTDHCFVVLHLYDQVMHGIKAIFKQLPDLEENEEIALEELCSPEPEAEYQGLETDGP